MVKWRNYSNISNYHGFNRCGCSINGQYTITEPDQLVVSGEKSDFNGFEISCNGLDDGYVIIDVQGGTDHTFFMVYKKLTQFK